MDKDRLSFQTVSLVEEWMDIQDGMGVQKSRAMILSLTLTFPPPDLMYILPSTSHCLFIIKTSSHLYPPGVSTSEAI